MNNFNNQWIEVFSAGSHTDSDGRTHQIASDFLESVARNFQPSVHEAPAVVGHPSDNSPAYGWVDQVRVAGDKLEAHFKEVDPAFEQLVAEGKFKKRSASFYVDPKTAPGGVAPYLRHVGFLGAQPPAVKGLRDISFGEGESLEFADCEFRIADFGEDTMKDEDVKTITDRVMESIKGLFGGKKDDAASFSEADAKKLIAEAVNATTASFTEEKKSLEKKIEDLTKAVHSQTGHATRADITAFVEKLGLAKLPPAQREGIVEFMEALAGVEQKVTVVSFSEEGGVKKEIKTESTPLAWFKSYLEKQKPLIAFGERFGHLKATGTEGEVVDPARMNALRNEAGLKVVESAK